MSWEDVKKEMVQDKGLAEEVADKIGEYVKLKGGMELVNILKSDPALSANARVMEGVEEMRILMEYLNVMDVMPQVSRESC